MSWKSKLLKIAVIAPFIAGGAVLYRITPEKTWWMPPCLFHKITGLYCPGCGTARGFHKLLHGDLLGAWRMNQLTLLMLPFAAYLIASAYRRTPDSKLSSPPTWMGWVVIAAIVAYWIVRNIPAYPFTLLAPH